MLAKLAVRNVGRSLRDYGVYFVTLAFGVAMFYAFNSIGSQQVLFDLKNEASESIFEVMGQMLGLFSGVIAFVLGFLVVYANRFLVRRRKREFGLYLMLGMRPLHVSCIVLLETFLVGLLALAAGLATGVAVSQGLSFVTAALFNVQMARYQFVFSADAFGLTLLCFVGLFAVVALFNTLTVARCRLADLLEAHRSNESFVMRSPALGAVLFAVSIAVLAAAYRLLVENGLLEFEDPKFALSTVLMVAGTLLFFFSASSFAVLVVQRLRVVYFKSLAMFTMRQIASKINTAFVSLAFVCVTLFFSITVFSSGMGMVNVFTQGVEKGTAFDASLSARLEWAAWNRAYWQDPANWQATQATPEEAQKALEEVDAVESQARADGLSIVAALERSGVDFTGFVDAVAEVRVFACEDVSYGDVVDLEAAGLDEETQADLADDPVQIVRLSEYNAVRALAGDSPISLPEDGYAVSNVVDSLGGVAGSLAEQGRWITIAGVALESASAETYDRALYDSDFYGGDAPLLVVPDRVVDAMGDVLPQVVYADFQYSVGQDEGDKLMAEALVAALSATSSGDEAADVSSIEFRMSEWPVSSLTTAAEIVTVAGGMRMMLTYLALYIGFVFLIATAAILAIQQLSETNDSLERYRVLSKIGCDRGMIVRTLRTQMAVYFLAPLALALCHSACAVGVVAGILRTKLETSIESSVGWTVLLIVVVYGVYLAVTYGGCRTMVLQAAKGRVR